LFLRDAGKRVGTISRAAEALVLTASAPLALEPEEARRSAELAARIRARMAAAGGWLPFSAFMQAALYEPELGYYAVDRPIFGAAGDFVTAPELSPLFARCLAAAAVPILDAAGGGEVLEFGAGSGRMAADLIAALAHRGQVPRRYRIVEPSRAMQRRQRDFLFGHPATAPMIGRFEWLDAPSPESWTGVALANEVVDAMPVDRFRVVEDGCEVIGVSADGDGFRFVARPAHAALAAAVAGIQSKLPAPMPPGYVSEFRPGVDEWMRDAAAGLERGAFIVSDYGLPRAQYYHPARDGGSLAGFRGQLRVDDPLAMPGAQDLTAWVDFSALADAARGAGLDVGGFATQAHFLLETGIERELAALVEGAGERERAMLKQGAATLLLPGEMGERFKLLALTREFRGPLDGFGFRDLSASL
jgi:SAM-dependent MidA family methyltransferase